MSTETYFLAAISGLAGTVAVLSAAIRVLWRQHLRDLKSKDEIAQVAARGISENTRVLEQVREVLRAGRGKR